MLQIPSQAASMTWALDGFRRYARARVQTGSTSRQNKIPTGEG